MIQYNFYQIDHDTCDSLKSIFSSKWKCMKGFESWLMSLCRVRWSFCEWCPLKESLSLQTYNWERKSRVSKQLDD